MKHIIPGKRDRLVIEVSDYYPDKGYHGSEPILGYWYLYCYRLLGEGPYETPAGKHVTPVLLLKGYYNPAGRPPNASHAEWAAGYVRFQARGAFTQMVDDCARVIGDDKAEVLTLRETVAQYLYEQVLKMEER